MSDWMNRIAESKRATRRDLAALPFAEKLRLLEQMRDRAQLMKKFRPRPAGSQPNVPLASE